MSILSESYVSRPRLKILDLGGKTNDKNQENIGPDDGAGHGNGSAGAACFGSYSSGGSGALCSCWPVQELWRNKL